MEGPTAKAPRPSLGQSQRTPSSPFGLSLGPVQRTEDRASTLTSDPGSTHTADRPSRHSSGVLQTEHGPQTAGPRPAPKTSVGPLEEPSVGAPPTHSRSGAPLRAPGPRTDVRLPTAGVGDRQKGNQVLNSSSSPTEKTPLCHFGSASGTVCKAIDSLVAPVPGARRRMTNTPGRNRANVGLSLLCCVQSSRSRTSVALLVRVGFCSTCAVL